MNVEGRRGAGGLGVLRLASIDFSGDVRSRIPCRDRERAGDQTVAIGCARQLLAHHAVHVTDGLLVGIGLKPRLTLALASYSRGMPDMLRGLPSALRPIRHYVVPIGVFVIVVTPEVVIAAASVVIADGVPGVGLLAISSAI